MKKYSLLFLIFLGNNCLGQNIGIGIATPLNKLQVSGNLLVNAPYTHTSALPTVAQTITMVNGNTLIFTGADSTGRIYDPGGLNGNYNSNLTAQLLLDVSSTTIGYELILEDVDLGTGDSLLVRIDDNPVLSIGNGYTSLGTWIVNAPFVYVTFKSNNDGINGRGFNLRIRRLYEDTGAQPSLTGQAGKALFFDTKSGAFRAGTISALPIGNYSTGLGFYSTASGLYAASLGGFNKASGDHSFAAGYSTTASGFNSTAFGSNTIASGQHAVAAGQNAKAFGLNAIAIGNTAFANGNHSLALGPFSVATGQSSTAIGTNTNSIGQGSFAIGSGVYVNGSNAVGIGNNISAGGAFALAMGTTTIADGNHSTAMGNGTTASGHYSTAMGNYVSTSGFNGAFVLGDNSTNTVMGSFVANGFRSRFAGGYRLLTNSAASLGVVLLPDGGSWSAISDMRLKENFLVVDAEQILKKIAALPLTTWNYTAQNLKTSRHYGPMAQDFYKAFGHDGLGEIGCDTLINQQDFLGVNLIAIQALEKRTSLQEKDIEDLKASNALLQQQIYMLMKKRK